MYKRQKLGTDDELLTTLAQTSLDDWRTRALAIGGQKQRALVDVATIIQPDIVEFSLPRPTLTTEQDVDAYVKTLHERLRKAVKANPIQLT